MKQVKINLTDELDFNEYRKQICFFSQKITSFRREGNSLIIECEDNANTDKIEKKANDALKKNLESKKEDIVIDEHLKKCKYHNDFYRDGFIKKNSGGFVSLEGDAVILYEFFDNEFRKIAEKLDAKEERYPILLGIDTMKDTGYYRRSPQYTMLQKILRIWKKCRMLHLWIKTWMRLFKFHHSLYLLLHVFMYMKSIEDRQCRKILLLL